MAEKIISPGVFTNEIDQTFLPSAVADIGAAIVGPTLKGPAGIPTVVTSFSDFQAKFGDVFRSGSDSVQFLTSHAAEEYLKNSDTLTVVRVMAGAFGPASANILTTGSSTVTGVNLATGSVIASSFPATIGQVYKVVQGSSTFKFISSGDGGGDAADDSIRFFVNGSTTGAHITNLTTEINAVSSLNVIANSGSSGLSMTGSSAGTGNNGIKFTTASAAAPSTFTTAPAGNAVGGGVAGAGGAFTMTGGTDGAGTSTTAFTLETLADGTIMNNANTTAQVNNVLVSGSKHNIRFEVLTKNDKKGTFNLTIRAGNDSSKRKQSLETYNNLSLDPNSLNYIAKVIGDQTQQVKTEGSTKYLQLSGSYPNASRFVRVKSVGTPTSNYLDENGNVSDIPVNGGHISHSLPQVGSGSSNGGFSGGSDGHSGFNALGHFGGNSAATTNALFYEEITATNTQGFDPTAADDGKNAYEEALDLLANQDEFDINLILMPGIIDSLHPAITKKAIDVCEDRGDCFAIIDPVPYASTLTAATARGGARDSNFAAMYWPWVKVPDSQVGGTQRWVPPSTVLGGIYSFNDRVAHPWFAPAGLNRGGITTAIQAERKLTQGNRDDLYDNNINPIATFPGQGVTVFGQKTLQKKASALDRINVRRLLIRVKKFIASSSRFLVFEQNTSATRRRFLGIVNPFLENVQSQSGLSAFRVVMDETNNTPDTIDRNQLVGQLFLQPTRTAEFIVLDFTIQPTGASFPE